jgi:hypothetical protein
MTGRPIGMVQLTFLWGNGGGVVTAALLMVIWWTLLDKSFTIPLDNSPSNRLLPAQNPSKAPLSAFAKNEVMVIWTICW